MYPNLSLSASQSMPDLAFKSSTPRAPGTFSSFLPRSPSVAAIPEMRPSTPSVWGDESMQAGTQRSPQGRANEELARFFKEKAERGDEPLTAVEQAGVFHLMQQGVFSGKRANVKSLQLTETSRKAQTESVPTAFTPQFKSLQPHSNVRELTCSTLSRYCADFPPPQPFARGGSAAPSVAGSAYSGAGSATGAAGSASSPFRRRRPVYVGAGYSSQSARRRKTGSSIFSEGALKRSQSEGIVFSLLDKPEVSSVVDGKRRRVEEPVEEPVAVAPAPVAAPASVPTTGAPTKPASSVFAAPKFSALTTPARPSPLWQVSKAGEGSMLAKRDASK